MNIILPTKQLPLLSRPHRKSYWLKLFLFVLLLCASGGYLFWKSPPPSRPKVDILKSKGDPLSLLRHEIYLGNTDNVRKLVEHYPYLTDFEKNFPTYKPNLLISAIGLSLPETSSRLESAEILLKAGADVNYYVGGTNSALKCAINYDKPKFISLFIRYGADADTWPDPPAEFQRFNWIELLTQKPPLYVAIRRSHFRSVDALLQNHASLTFKQDMNAIHYACNMKNMSSMRRKGIKQTIRVLLKHGADINQPDNSKIRLLPIHYAAKTDCSIIKDNLMLMKFLLEETKINVNGTTALGHATALHFAIGFNSSRIYPQKNPIFCRKEKQEMIKLLIKHGARTDIKTYKGQTAIDLANGSQVILTILAKAKNPPLVKEVRE